MPRDKTANHIKIIAAAKAEFMEKGFDKSSMRSISKRCGMTAAGIYRHCVDKEDLFDQIVAPAVDRINAWLDAHVARYVGAVNHKEHIQWRDSEIDMMREIIYPNMEEYHLLLAKSRGSKYEHFLALFEPVIHNYSLEEALHCLKAVEAFFVPGWKQLFGF